MKINESTIFYELRLLTVLGKNQQPSNSDRETNIVVVVYN